MSSVIQLLPLPCFRHIGISGYKDLVILGSLIREHEIACRRGVFLSERLDYQKGVVLTKELFDYFTEHEEINFSGYVRGLIEKDLQLKKE